MSIELPANLKVGQVLAEPGETKWGPATWVELRDGTKVNLPVILVNGKGDGPTVVILGATHPTEQIGVHALQILTRKKVQPSKLRGKIIAFPIANPLAQQFSEYVSPHDGINMARAYPGSKDGSLTERFANFIWETAKNVDFVLDQHENAKHALMFSFVPDAKDKKTEKKALEFARAFGITVIKEGKTDFPGVYSSKEGYSVASLAMLNGIPAFTPEYETTTDIEFNENEPGMRVALTGLQNVLKKLGMIEGKIEKQTGIKILEGNFESRGMPVTKRGGVTRRPVDVGVKLKKGTTITIVLDAYGNEIERVRMPIDGYIWGWNVGVPPWFNWSLASGDPVAFIFREV